MKNEKPTLFFFLSKKDPKLICSWYVGAGSRASPISTGFGGGLNLRITATSLGPRRTCGSVMMYGIEKAPATAKTVTKPSAFTHWE